MWTTWVSALGMLLGPTTLMGVHVPTPHKKVAGSIPEWRAIKNRETTINDTLHLVRSSSVLPRQSGAIGAGMLLSLPTKLDDDYGSDDALEDMPAERFD
ncbi:unnamed protein product [Haemonchus placei]|uniref:Secreted protein n=1 Tax=Haemonchus placei TaxID=6290 RepID=A0A0N4WK73_HAEPC|nr:unnamed protein product [Haemonchus placei]